MQTLCRAVGDYSLLLTRGYAPKSALKLVGDRFQLTKRQRLAVMRSACSDQQRASRRRRCVSAEDLRGKTVALDGYNVLITLEAALSGAFILVGRDGCYRDLAGIHGTYRRVSQTETALCLWGEFLEQRGVLHATWYLDRPVSNSGKLRAFIGQVAEAHHWPWEVCLCFNPDKELVSSEVVVVSSDSVVLDGCGAWANLGAEIIGQGIPGVRLCDFSGG